MIWKAIIALFCSPRASKSAHDEDVHRLKNDAAKVFAEVTIASRQTRRLSHRLANPDEVQKKIDEAGKIVEEAKRMLDEHHQDADDGLLSGMDRSLKRGDDA